MSNKRLLTHTNFEDETPTPHKSISTGNSGGPSRMVNNLPDVLQPDEVQKIVDAGDETLIESINASNINRAVAQFDKKLKNNRNMRIQFPNNPEKFMKSEVDLSEEINKISSLTVSPDLITEFLNLGGMQNLVSLLTHANIDIAAEAVKVIGELVDADVVSELQEPEAFLDKLAEYGLVSLAVDMLMTIERDESNEDQEAVSNVLAMFESIVDVRPSVCDEIGTKAPKLIWWLIRRIRNPAKSSQEPNKVSASEILDILVQTSVPCREELGRKTNKIDGIDRLMRSINVYRKEDPKSLEEEELVRNLFNCLCSLMLNPVNQLNFGQNQGVELMIRFLKERKCVCAEAVKLTNYALRDCQENCHMFIEKLGLKHLFGMLMKKGLPVKRNSRAEEQLEEHLVAIVASLCKNCKGIAVSRLLNKFVENRCEKLERMLELHKKYYPKVSETRANISSMREAEELDTELNIDTEEQRYLDLCENGLFIIQSIDVTIVRLANMGNALVAQRIHTLLDTKGVDIQELVEIVDEYTDHLDHTASEERKTVGVLLTHFINGTDSSNVDE